MLFSDFHMYSMSYVIRALICAHICECAIETHVGTHGIHIHKIKIKTKEEAKTGTGPSCEVTGGV